MSEAEDEYGLTESDKNLLRRYLPALAEITEFGRSEPPKAIWHYTNADGLVGIIQEGLVRATHVSCLNDSLEHVHLSRLVAAEAAEIPLASSQQKDAIDNLVRTASTRLATRDSAFVTCFSTEEDDLAQWRGYGGHQIGFAIEFDVKGLMEGPIGKAPPNTMRLLRMVYDEDKHKALAQEIVRQFIELAEMFPKVPSDGFMREYGDFVLWMYSLVKHHKFKAESEIRLLSRLNNGTHTELKFRSKNTLLARYLNLDLKINGKLPIRSVMIGPGGDGETSRISVADLLASKGYTESEVSVKLSTAPYRIP